MVQLTCPNTERWQALLANSAAPDEASELESHLSGCTRCRSVLDDLAIGSSGWLRDANRLAGHADVDPMLTKTLHRLQDTELDDDHGGPPIALDFLNASDQPGILGTLGRYQVLAVIGRGAMGVVLKALDPDLLRPVAVKVLAPYLAPSGTARQRFLREARAAAAVSHDHVVTIHAVEPADLPYLVMEYVTGVSLQARLDRDGPLPAKDIARIGMQAARGLDAAHAQGLVHRDVKPANILLENGVERVKLTDFGLARAADDARLTASGTAAGTPLYMSPEQARGEAIDSRSDLFSLGSVLYALATGFPPFRATTTMGVLNRITNDPPRPIRETNPDFPAALEAIIMQLLEKNPARRIPSASDVANRLTEFLAAAPEPATPRRWWPIATALAVAATILIVGIVLTYKTPKGTLVVEVDDPAIKVALDGEELTITGAGTQELRVKPGTYQVTAMKDGKPARVSQDVVTITRDGKQILKVTVIPDAAQPDRPLHSTVLGERLALLVVDVPDEQKQLLHDVWLDIAGWRTINRTTKDGSTPQTHPSYQKLIKLVNEAGRIQTDSKRAEEALKEAIGLAKTILADTAESKRLMAKANPGNSIGLEDRFKKISADYDATIARLKKTPTGRILQTITYPIDVEKATASLTGDDADRTRRLLSLVSHYQIFAPKLPPELGKWEKAQVTFSHEEQRFKAGLIPQLDYDIAKTTLRDSERVLQSYEETMGGIVADLHKLADEFEAKVADDLSPDLKKALAEFDALKVRLAKTEVGRVLAIIPPDKEWSTVELGDLFAGDGEKTEPARKLLKLRDQIRLQHMSLKVASDFVKTKQAMPAGIGDAQEIDAIIKKVRESEQEIRLRTATIRGIVDDLKKLADQLDPPAKK